MTATSPRVRSSELTVAIATPDPIVRSLLVRVLCECRIPTSQSAVEELAVAVPKPDVVCTGSSGVAAVLELDFPTVIITRGLSVSDETWAELARRRPVVISRTDLTPFTLLDGVLRARFRVDLSDPPADLSWVPSALLGAFLRNPRRVGTIHEFSRASGLQVGALRAIEKSAGCMRFEGLVTRVRAGVWKWLVSSGVNRTVVEAYLGIEDRSHFYRACRRAMIAVPRARG